MLLVYFIFSTFFSIECVIPRDPQQRSGTPNLNLTVLTGTLQPLKAHHRGRSPCSRVATQQATWYTEAQSPVPTATRELMLYMSQHMLDKFSGTWTTLAPRGMEQMLTLTHHNKTCKHVNSMLYSSYKYIKKKKHAYISK